MTRRFVLGLDVGGGGARGLLLDLDSGAWHCEHRPVRAVPAPDLAGLGHDFDIPALDSALKSCVAAALTQCAATPGEILALACTSQRHSTVVLAADGAPLLATPNRDARGAAEGLRLAAEYGPALHAMSGHWPLPIFTAARLQWLRDQRPEAFERAHHVLSASEWLAWRLTGEIAADPTQAGETLLFELRDRCWSDEWIERLGLPRSLFPEPIEPGTPLGTLQPAAAEWLGLARGIPVAAGAADSQSGLLGCGALAPGQIVAIAGTTTPIQQIHAEPVVDREARVWSGQHVESGTRVLESNAGTMGDDLSNFASLLHPESPLPIARLLAEAADGPPGADGMLSTLGAEVMQARDRGLPYSNVGWSPMALAGGAQGRAVLSRALIEGAACAIAANAEQLDEVAQSEGAAIARAGGALVLTGGLSRSRTFCQIVADLTGAQVEQAGCAEASALGAALCAAVGGGGFDTLAEAAAACVPAPEPFEPVPERAEVSQATYRAWQAARLAHSASDGDAALHAMGAALRRSSGNAIASAPGYRPRILVTADLDAASVERLSKLGDVRYESYREQGRMLKDAALVEVAQDCEVLITEIDVVSAEAMAGLPALRLVASCRGDAVNVDVRAASLFGIPVLNTPGRNADAVADLTLGFLLMLARKLAGATRYLRDTEHEAGEMRVFGMAYGQFRGHELWGSTIGLVGLGAVGRQVAARLSGFGAELLVSDPFVDAERAALSGAKSVSLDELLERSDYISLHAPVNDATRGLIGRDALARMKPSAALINTARAALIDEAGLVEALANERLAAAALDVFSVEPPGSDHALLAHPNVIATPHMGGNTHEVSAHQGAILCDELERLLRAESPHFALNPDTLAAFGWHDSRRTPTAAELASLDNQPGPAVTDLARDSGES